eukprot:363396-Chlamydomonas_euryale.AAC.4
MVHHPKSDLRASGPLRTPRTPRSEPRWARLLVALATPEHMPQTPWCEHGRPLLSMTMNIPACLRCHGASTDEPCCLCQWPSGKTQMPWCEPGRILQGQNLVNGISLAMLK